MIGSRKSLVDIHKKHKGKVSDKWGLYLDVYDRSFQHLRGKQISLLEIGVQNGGSLEVWAKYFPRAKTILGCDIDPKCGELSYDDDRISVIVSDANSDQGFEAVTKKASSFDIIIDDGSHKSSDIVGTFGRYFDLLKPGGLYVAEDLHCSYWPTFEGGIFAERSAMAFFKALIDLINVDHWGPGEVLANVGGEKSEVSVDAIFDPFFPSGNAPLSLKQGVIRSIEVYDSVVIVRKSANATDSKLGQRYVVGDDAKVNAKVLNLRTAR